MQTILAAQMYTVRDFIKTPKGIDESFAKVKKAGYEAVQMSAWGPIDPKELKALADKHELIICATHVSYDEIVNDTQKLIEDHKLWDCKYIGLGSMPEWARESKDTLIKFVENLKPAGKMIADAGLHLIYHNHNFEFAKFGDTTIMELLLQLTDPSWFQFEIDTYWVQAGGASPVFWIEKVAGRMDIVHFKDMAYSSDKKETIMAEIGEGNLDWQSIISMCAKTKVKWHIVEQDVCLRDPFESLAISANNLHKMGLR